MKTRGKNNEASTLEFQDEQADNSIMNEKLNPKIVERWIANTLEDAKFLDIPGERAVANP